MRPTVFVNSEVQEVSKEAGFSYDSLSRTNMCDRPCYLRTVVSRRSAESTTRTKDAKKDANLLGLLMTTTSMAKRVMFK